MPNPEVSLNVALQAETIDARSPRLAGWTEDQFAATTTLTYRDFRSSFQGWISVARTIT